MPVDLHELDNFAAVARHRSFRKAARERGVSASALSHAVRVLEERLGVRLLNRTTRSVMPTEAGLRILACLEPAMRDIAETLTEIQGLQDVPAGPLRLSVPRQAARLILAPILAAFGARYPRVQLEIITDDRLIDIVSEGFDAGIRFGESLAADMVVVPIGEPLRFVVVGSADYLEVHGTPRTPRELTDHSCIGRRFPSGSLYQWEFERDGQAMSVAVNGSLVVDDDELMVRAAIDGAGLAYVYETQVRAAVASGMLTRVLDDWCQTPARFFLYYPGRRQLPRALRALVDFIRANSFLG
jgi:DNA-binding transcriptional LysR family regulator